VRIVGCVFQATTIKGGHVSRNASLRWVVRYSIQVTTNKSRRLRAAFSKKIKIVGNTFQVPRIRGEVFQIAPNILGEINLENDADISIFNRTTVFTKIMVQYPTTQIF
jgi:hypothetical protein